MTQVFKLDNEDTLTLAIAVDEYGDEGRHFLFSLKQEGTPANIETYFGLYEGQMQELIALAIDTKGGGI